MRRNTKGISAAGLPGAGMGQVLETQRMKKEVHYSQKYHSVLKTIVKIEM